jgi:hypothetical protein
MYNIDFRMASSKRREADQHFNNTPIYVGDLVEYKRGKLSEIGEVQEVDGYYYVGGKELKLLTGIKRVINMGK